MQRRLCGMSEAKWSITEAKCLQISHNKFASQRDAISPSMGDLILSHSAGMHNTYISITGICPNKFERAKGSKRFHFASLITHNLRCIPAYAHLIPTGFFQSLLNYHRDNMYIIPFFCMMRGPNGGDGCFLCFGLVDMDFRQKCSIFWRRMKKGWGSFSWGSWCDESGISFEFLYYK